jgi:hypothetical protein
MTRALSRRAFQWIAVALLVAIESVVGQWISRGSAPARLVGDAFVGGGVLVVLSIVAWAIVIAPIRRMSEMPTLREELAARNIQSMRQLADQARGAYRDARTASPPVDRVAARARARQQLLGLAIVLPIAALATIANWLEAPDSLLLAPPAVAIACVVMLPVLVVRSLR